MLTLWHRGGPPAVAVSGQRWGTRSRSGVLAGSTVSATPWIVPTNLKRPLESVPNTPARLMRVAL